MFRYATHILFAAIGISLCNFSIAQERDQTQLLIGHGWGKDRFMFYAPDAVDTCSGEQQLIYDAVVPKIKNRYPESGKNPYIGDMPQLPSNISRYFKAIELGIKLSPKLSKLVAEPWIIKTEAGMQSFKLDVFVEYDYPSGGQGACWLLGTSNWQMFEKNENQNFLSVAVQNANGNAALVIAKAVAQGFRDLPEQSAKLKPSVMKQIESIPKLKAHLKKVLNFETEVVEAPHVPVQVTEEEWIKKGYQAYVDKRKTMPPPAPPKQIAHGEDKWQLGGMQKFRAAIAKENRDFLMFYLITPNSASHEAGVNAVVDLSQKRVCHFRPQKGEDDVEVISILGVLDSNQNGTDEWLVSYSYYEGTSYAIVEPEVKDGKCELKTLTKTAYFGL